MRAWWLSWFSLFLLAVCSLAYGQRCDETYREFVRVPYPVRAKSPDLHFTVSSDGFELPILDYTNPRFHYGPPTPIRLFRSNVFLIGLSLMPPPLRRFLGSHSYILQNFFPTAANAFVTGPSTYLAKLGPGVKQLTYLDKNASQSLQSIEASRRGYAISLQQNEVLHEWLEGSDAKEPITFLNIGGGPASDNLNALLWLRHHHASTFETARAQGTPFRIRVLDSDAGGAVMGERSLTILKGKDAPLAGLNASFDRLAYDWSHPETLIPELDQTRGHVLVTAEGSLFEYGTDEEVLANLRTLRDHTPGDTVVSGSIYRTYDQMPLSVRLMQRLAPHLRWKYRGAEKLRELAAQAGWTCEVPENDNAIFLTFVLKKAN